MRDFPEIFNWGWWKEFCCECRWYHSMGWNPGVNYEGKSELIIPSLTPNLPRGEQVYPATAVQHTSSAWQTVSPEPK